MFNESHGIWFRLAPGNDPVGVACGEDGLFLGRVPLLEFTYGRDGHKSWAPLPTGELNAVLIACYGMPIDFTAKSGGLAAVANALNRGEGALARIAAVHLGLPELPSLAKGTPAPERLAKLLFILRRSGLLKEDWDPADHPRWPAGSPDGAGGEFAPAGGEDTDAPALAQIGSPECEEEWDYAEESCRNLMKSPSFGATGRLGFGQSFNQCVRGMVSERCGGSPVA